MSALKITLLASVATFAVALAACGDEAPTAASGSAQAVKSAPAMSAKPSATTAMTTAPTATAATADADDVPTPADFEDEATADIHPANAETELAALEKEIAEDH
jgi:hypothetical protein